MALPPSTIAVTLTVFTIVMLVFVWMRIQSSGAGSSGRGGPPPPGSPNWQPPGPVPQTPFLQPPKSNDPPTPPKVKPGIVGPKTTGPGPSQKPANPVYPVQQKVFADLSPYFNGIRSQGSLEACTSFAATSVFEYFFRTHNYNLPGNYLSPLFTFYYSRINDGASATENRGLFSSMSLMKTLISEGAPLEIKWPLDETGYAKEPSLDAKNDAVLKKLATFRTLDYHNPDDWAYEIVHNKNPIYIAVRFPRDWHTGHYRDKFYAKFGNVNDIAGGHAMVIVGYDSHYPYNGSGVKAFKIRNSHGTTWGENGYTWIPAETLKSIIYGGVNSPYILEGWNPGQQNREEGEGREDKNREQIEERQKEEAEEKKEKQEEIVKERQKHAEEISRKEMIEKSPHELTQEEFNEWRKLTSGGELSNGWAYFNIQSKGYTGWKIHVSANSIREVLEIGRAIVPTLRRRGIYFSTRSNPYTGAGLHMNHQGVDYNVYLVSKKPSDLKQIKASAKKTAALITRLLINKKLKAKEVYIVKGYRKIPFEKSGRLFYRYDSSTPITEREGPATMSGSRLNILGSMYNIPHNPDIF